MRRARRALLLVTAVSGGAAWWATSTYYESHYRERLEATEKRRELAQDELRRVREGALQAPGCTITKDSEEHFIRTLSSAGSPVVTLIPTEGDARSRIFTHVLLGSSLALAGRLRRLLLPLLHARTRCRE